MARPSDYPTVSCPKCTRTLHASGEVELSEGQPTPTYQCDECLMTVDFCGEKMELALTFVLNAKGQPVDPADPENVLRF